MATALLTGFPGFLGSALLPRVLAASPETTATCLVQPRWAALAARRVEELVATDPALDGRVRLVEGDITRPHLGLEDPAEVAGRTGEIWHLAAVFDITAPEAVCLPVNLDGTRHVLDLAERCPELARVHYISTCYVGGRHPGMLAEDDLDVGQSFNNAYEESKFRAEAAVRERMDDGLPATVYRPALMVGDSRTGATQKYDGLYLVVRLLLRQPRVAVLPVVGDPARTCLNVVPRDFVVAAIAHLSGLERSAGKVYQLADPDPLPGDRLLDELARATARRLIKVPLPLWAAKGALARVPGVERLLRIPPAAIDYFVHRTRYDTTNARADLAGSGIAPPPFPSYVDALVDFVRAHPEVGTGPMT
ncbi:MAG: SDR family oxidoreductase [Acidimicrobiales bacterium]